MRSRASAMGGSILLVVSLVVSSGCRVQPTTTSDPVAPTPEGNASGKYTLFTHPADSRFVEADTEGGGRVTYLGDRDAEGLPTRVRKIFSQDAAQRETAVGTWLDVDADGRLTRIIGADGSSIDLTWSDDTHVLVSAVSADGSAQINTAPDLTDGSGVSSRSFVRSLTPLDVPPIPSNQAVALVVVSLRRCGAVPALADVLDVHLNVPSLATPFLTAREDGGRYVGQVPLQRASPITDEDRDKICKSLGNIVFKSCKDPVYARRTETRICDKIGVALDAAGLTGAQGTPIRNACHEGFAAAKKGCGALGLAEFFGGEAAARAAAADAVCKDVKKYVDQLFDTPTSSTPVTATATLKGSGTKTSAVFEVTQPLPGGSPPAQTTIDFGLDRIQVLSFTTQPADPRPGEGYAVKIDVDCAAGVALTATVSGTDGYSASHPFTPTEAKGSLTFSVPGAKQSVNDTIRLLSGTEVIRTIGVVF